MYVCVLPRELYVLPNLKVVSTRVCHTYRMVYMYVYLTWKMCIYTCVCIYHSPGKIPIHTDYHLYIGHTHTYLPQGRVSFHEGLCMCGHPA